MLFPVDLAARLTCAGANVLIHEEGRLQLCDFGVANVLDTRTDKRRTFIGTLHWMPPELWTEKPEYSDEVSDRFLCVATGPTLLSTEGSGSALTDVRWTFGDTAAQFTKAP